MKSVITIAILFSITAVAAVEAEEMKYKNIAGKYLFKTSYYCKYDDGERFTKQFSTEVKVVYSATSNLGDVAGYDMYFIIDDNNQIVGNVFRGPNRNSKRSWYSFFYGDDGETGYLRHRWSKDLLNVRAEHATVLDGWVNDEGRLREYSCRVKKTGIMLEQINYSLSNQELEYHPKMEENR